MIKVAINGYGRIGRNVHRQFIERFPNEVVVVAINASSDSVTRAHLLKYDSLHGRFGADISVIDDNNISVNGVNVSIVKERNPAACPWGKLDIDMVIESTGAFITYEKAKAHIEAGAKKVVVTAPMKDDTTTIVLGVNDEKLSGDLDIVSNASCTTNCIAPPIKIIDEAFGIKRLLVNSVHAFTATQNILDNKCKEGNDLRKARAATLSMIPTKTGAVKACAVIFPHLKGKLDGMAFRVPVPTVSCAYMAFFLKTETTREEVIAKLKEASEGSMKNILSVTQEELVSIDYQTDPHSSIVDEEFTKVVDGKALQLLAWYDNEWGYAMRVTELVQKLSKLK